MKLPNNAVVLGMGGTFLVPLGGFNGWMRVDEDPWQEDHCSGKTAGIEYAAAVGSDVWKLNTPDLWNGMQAVADEAVSLEDDIAELLQKESENRHQQILEKSVWSAAMPTPTEEQLNDSMVSEVGPMRILPPNLHVEQTPLNPSDPYGIAQHEPGAKNDSGKIMAGLLLNFGDALLAVASASTLGAVKYSIDGWKSVPDGIRRYRDAGMRHRLQLGNDPESKMPHLWHAAWNILAEIQLLIDNGACPHPTTIKLPEYQSQKHHDSMTSLDCSFKTLRCCGMLEK